MLEEVGGDGVDGALPRVRREGGGSATCDRRDVLVDEPRLVRVRVRVRVRLGLGFGVRAWGFVDEPRLARLDHVDSPLARRTVGVRGGEDGDLSLEIRELWGSRGLGLG